MGTRIRRGLLGVLIAAMFASPAAAADMTITTSTTLTTDVSGTVFVGTDGVTLDCAGHSITAAGWAAIDLTGRTGVTVKNCRVGGANVGIWLNGSSGNTITGNTATGNTNAGIFLWNGSNDNVVSANSTNANGWYGIWLQAGSNGNTVTGNTANANPFSGIFVIFASHDRLLGNTANGNGGAPVGPLDAGQGFYLFGADHITVSGNAASGNVSDGFQLRFSSNNTLTQNNASGNTWNGFRLWDGSSDNTLDGNVGNDNHSDGLLAFDAHGQTTVSNSVGDGNGAYGFDLNRSSGVTFANDSAARNTFGGFFNILSTGTAYTGNTAHDNGGASVGPLDEGEGFYLYETDATAMSGNLATSNATDGFQLRGATHTVLKDNKSLGNDRIGFGLFADDLGNQSTANVLSSNLGRGNKAVDAQDTSSAGNNTWTNNSLGSAALP